MPGRFALAANAEQLEEYLQLSLPELYMPRYNISPTTPVLAVTESSLTFFSWGLVPAWADDVNIGHRMFNARAETVADKPSFRNSFKRRRCLVPATGFYEWKSEPGGKQPYYCRLDRALFCFAGIWEYWADSMGNELQTCAILTRQSSGAMQGIDQRMPVVLREQDRSKWLDHSDEKLDGAEACISCCETDFSYYPVGSRVNSTANDSADLLKKLE